MKEIAAEGVARREQAAKLAAEPGVAGEINPHHLCAKLVKALGPSGVVINEAIRNIPTVVAQMPRTEPGTLVGLAGAGLGFSGSVALGLKLAMPDRIVMPIMGDGTFYFSNPQSMLAVSQVRPADVHRRARQIGLGCGEGGDLARLSGGRGQGASDSAPSSARHGLRQDRRSRRRAWRVLSDPAAVDGAIARCLAAVRSGRSAVLHAKVTKI